MKKPVTLLKGEGVAKQYREEWNKGIKKLDKVWGKLIMLPSNRVVAGAGSVL